MHVLTCKSRTLSVAFCFALRSFIPRSNISGKIEKQAIKIVVKIMEKSMETEYEGRRAVANRVKKNVAKK